MLDTRRPFHYSKKYQVRSAGTSTLKQCGILREFCRQVYSRCQVWSGLNCVIASAATAVLSRRSFVVYISQAHGCSPGADGLRRFKTKMYKLTRHTHPGKISVTHRLEAMLTSSSSASA